MEIEDYDEKKSKYTLSTAFTGNSSNETLLVFGYDDYQIDSV